MIVLITGASHTGKTALAQRLRTLFGASPHSAVSSLIGVMDALSPALQQAVSAKGDTRLGGQVKYGQLLCILSLAEYAAQLEGS